MKIIVIGGKGTAVNIAEQIVDARETYGENVEFLGFAFDDPSFGSDINGYPILCKTNVLNDKFGKYQDIGFIFALYRPDKMKERTELLRSYQIPSEKFCNFVHPSSYRSKSSSLGFGNVILANSSIQSNVRIGNFNIINSNVVIEHDSELINNNFIASSATIGSFIKINNAVFIGLNSTIREKVEIQNNAFIGMGSNVLSDVGPGKMVFGNPARERI